ncbi:putative G3BP-like protein [Phalaenopsis equestris]|uniref:putative G3BP-like protein n=2 Tax=Phalaenopsis equestris TaxID=78828 RepID=UPI0009E38A73|nr:putative G3BP-like protein [Phalaenopsis equestris]
MAPQQSSPAGAPPSAQVVGNVFVQQFFHILHRSPALIHQFYQDSSKLGRPGANGEMITVSSLQGIDEKILSMNCSEYLAQIKTVDAQESLDGGVMVLVTGCLIGKDNAKRDFTQTFFLATQDKGYYVLNDIFRFLDVDDQQEEQDFTQKAAGQTTEHDSIPSQEETVLQHTAATPEENVVNEEESYVLLESGEGSAAEDEEPVEEVINESPTDSPAAVTAPSLSDGQEHKKSYASIVMVMKENSRPVSVPTSASARLAPVNTERQAVTPAPVLATSSEIAAEVSNVEESSNVQESEADGFSIYVKNLPLNASTAQLEEEFKKFGPIKSNGVQVRSNKLQGFCFGFVEFEVAGAVQSAIEASPIPIGGRQAYVEEKRATSSRVNNRGRFPPGRGGGYRNDGLSRRGSYVGGRGYGRGDYTHRSDFISRGGRGNLPSSRGEVGYQRVDHTNSNSG